MSLLFSLKVARNLTGNEMLIQCHCCYRWKQIGNTPGTIGLSNVIAVLGRNRSLSHRKLYGYPMSLLFSVRLDRKLTGNEMLIQCHCCYRLKYIVNTPGTIRISNIIAVLAHITWQTNMERYVSQITLLFSVEFHRKDTGNDMFIQCYCFSRSNSIVTSREMILLSNVIAVLVESSS